MERLLLLPMVEDVRSNFTLCTIKATMPLPLNHLNEVGVPGKAVI